MADELRPQLYEILDPGHVTAMQWRPDNVGAAAALLGWLLGAGVEVSHPSGFGASTILAFRCDECGVRHRADAGDWVARSMAGHWFTWPDAEFGSNYRLMTFMSPATPAPEEPTADEH